MRFQPGDEIQTKTVRFRTLGCWPVTGAVESDATELGAVVYETLLASTSERQGRISDGEDGGSLEQKKREGLFLTMAAINRPYKNTVGVLIVRFWR